MLNFINKIVDLPKLIRRIWILLWVILIMLLVLKFCFGIWYPIVVENETFINVCNFIDNTKWLNIGIMSIFYTFSANVICLTGLGRKKFNNIFTFIIFEVLIISAYVIKFFNGIIGNVFEVFYCVILVIILNLIYHNFDKKWKSFTVPLVNYVLLNLWQLLIYLVRGLNLSDLESYGFTIGLILMLDYYVFILTNWMEVSFMGLWSIGWLFGKSITELKALKEKELNKEKPDLELVKEIDKAIEKKENESK